MPYILKIRRNYESLAWILLAFCTGMQVLAIVAGFFEPPPDRRWLWWLVLPTPWIFFQMLAIWMIAASRKQRLVVDGEQVSLCGVFSHRQLLLKDIVSCRWRRNWSTMLTTPHTRLVIDWRDYERSEIDPVMKWVRQRIPAELQQGWETFAFGYVMPVERRFPERKLEQVVINRRTWAKWCLPGAVLGFIVGVLVDANVGTARYCIGPLPILALWAYLHFLTPPEGFKMLRLSDSPRPDAKFHLQLAGVVLFGVTSLFLIMAGLKLYPEYEAVGVGLMILAGVAAFSAIGYLGYHSDKEQSKHDTERSRQLVPEWEHEWIESKP